MAMAWGWGGTLGSSGRGSLGQALRREPALGGLQGRGKPLVWSGKEIGTGRGLSTGNGSVPTAAAPYRPDVGSGFPGHLSVYALRVLGRKI